MDRFSYLRITWELIHEIRKFIDVMNQASLVKIEGAFSPDALRVLRGAIGVDVVAHEGKNDGRRVAAARVEFGGANHLVTTTFRKRVNAAVAWQFVHET